MSWSFIIAHTWNGIPVTQAEQVNVSLHWQTESTPDGLHITIDAPYHADPPPKSPKGSLWGLWEYEVVEVFLVDHNGHYTELEFGPHGHYLGLRLTAPRQISEKHLSLEYVATIDRKRWTAKAFVAQQHLPKKIASINLFAIHGSGQHRRYLSWSPLPGTVPNFHQPHVFPAPPK